MRQQCDKGFYCDEPYYKVGEHRLCAEHAIAHLSKQIDSLWQALALREPVNAVGSPPRSWGAVRTTDTPPRMVEV